MARLRRSDSIDSRSCMPWKVVWLPFGEVPGRKQILDWWAVELAQACSFPSTIFHIRMSCYATLILGKNHSRDNLIVCRISGCTDIDLPLQVSGVSLICEVRDELHLLHDGLNMGPQDSNDLRKMSLMLLVLRRKRMYHHSYAIRLVWMDMRSLNHLRCCCRRHCVRWLLVQ